ncbi:MAG: segregation/condensation protein A [Clostridia bacterium]|jgi:segregation and condensation protein A|nr:segregation/condensation protein A [Clostridia bacterium]
MVYQVRIPVFEGPMDLLLHLLDKNEVDIYDIPIALISSQYIEYLSMAEEIDLELTSEFLLMACTLLSIKARMLLPKRRPEGEEILEDDPRMELVQKIIEYKLYKDIAGDFRERELNQSKLFCREIDEAGLLKQFPPANPLGNVAIADLLAAYGKVLRKIERRREVMSIAREEITLQDKIDEIIYALAQNPGGLSFHKLFTGLTQRSEVIVTFLALLELSRRGLILLRQNKLFGDILIYFKDFKGGLESAHTVS